MKIIIIGLFLLNLSAVAQDNTSWVVFDSNLIKAFDQSNFFGNDKVRFEFFDFKPKCEGTKYRHRINKCEEDYLDISLEYSKSINCDTIISGKKEVVVVAMPDNCNFKVENIKHPLKDAIIINGRSFLHSNLQLCQQGCIDLF